MFKFKIKKNTFWPKRRSNRDNTIIFYFTFNFNPILLGRYTVKLYSIRSIHKAALSQWRVVDKYLDKVYLSEMVFINPSRSYSFCQLQDRFFQKVNKEARKKESKREIEKKERKTGIKKEWEIGVQTERKQDRKRDKKKDRKHRLGLHTFAQR